jgi:hypothetical protein
VSVCPGEVLTWIGPPTWPVCTQVPPTAWTPRVHLAFLGPRSASRRRSVHGQLPQSLPRGHQVQRRQETARVPALYGQSCPLS